MSHTHLPDKSVTWTKVSLKEAKMWQTPNTFSPSATCGPKLMTCSSFFSLPLRGAISEQQQDRYMTVSSFSTLLKNFMKFLLLQPFTKQEKSSYHWQNTGKFWGTGKFLINPRIRSFAVSWHTGHHLQLFSGVSPAAFHGS